MRHSIRARLLLVALIAGISVSTVSAQFVTDHLYVTDFAGVVHDVDPVGWTITTFADTSDWLNGTSAAAFTAAGTLLTSNFNTSQIIEFDGAGDGTLILDSSDGFRGPFGENGAVQDSSGRVYFADHTLGQILRFDSDYTNGTVFADASDGVVSPDGMAFDASGDMLVANRGSGGQVLEIAPDGTTTVFDTVTGENMYSVAIRGNRDIYVASATGAVYRYIGGSAGSRVLLGTYSTGNVTIEFNRDHSLLYHMSEDGSLSTVDPDTGSETVVIASGLGSSVGLAVFGDCPGTFTEYGTGLAGDGGFVPALHGTGNPSLGGSITIQIRDCVGGATGLLMVGLTPAAHAGFGGTLYVSFAGAVFVPLALPGAGPGDGDMDLSGTLSTDPSLACLNVYMQALCLDPAAVRNVAMSNGLDMFIGGL